jgi:hypothetical protein
VIEEDSGIPSRSVGKGQWDFSCFGKYRVPRKPFGKYFQDDLDKACKAMPARPLPFMIGYRRPEDTFLLVATRKSGAGEALAPTGAPTTLDLIPSLDPAAGPPPVPPLAPVAAPALAPATTPVPSAPAAAATNTLPPLVPAPTPAPASPPAR